MIWKNLSFISLGALLPGCAGYNHTLFMTKSNAGLDFDAKPPTAEVTISRKEVVIAPAFEQGQTPPVLASFKPDAGADGPFVNFFLGVDQTFAGGDAARAMTELYDRRDVPPDRDPTSYDSTLRLSKKPKGPIASLDVPGPGKVRPFIFGTDTMLGLKVAWSGAGGQMPDTVKAGFNRKEFAWAPLVMRKATKDTETPWHVKMPSFLATIDSRIGSDTNYPARISALQYFATGEAATRLALQPDVRAAMLARLDPNRDHYGRRFRLGEEPEQLATFARMLVSVRDGLEDIARSDSVAAKHVKALDQAAAKFNVPTNFQTRGCFYYSLSASNVLTWQVAHGNYPAATPFASLIRFWSDLTASYAQVRGALLAVEAGTPVSVPADGSTHPLGDVELKLLRTQGQLQAALLRELSQKVSGSEPINEACRYFTSVFNPDSL